MHSEPRSSRYCPLPNHRRRVDVLVLMIEALWRASCGCSNREHAGKIYPEIVAGLPTALVDDDYWNGIRKASGSNCGVPSWVSWMNVVNSIGPNPLLMAALPQQKKGASRRKDQERQGNQVDGGGRRPRSSFGELPGLSDPARSHVNRTIARKDRGASVKRGTSTQESNTAHL